MIQAVLFFMGYMQAGLLLLLLLLLLFTLFAAWFCDTFLGGWAAKVSKALSAVCLAIHLLFIGALIGLSIYLSVTAIY